MNASGKNNPRPKRRQVYIKKDFQTRFIIKFILIFILGGAISIGLTMLISQDTLTSSFADSKLMIQKTSLAIMPSVVFTALITTFLVSIVAVLVTLFVSHKIAGPIYRFEMDIERIASGDLSSRIRLRKGDQFTEIVTTLNNMIDCLNKNLSALKNEAESLAGSEDLSEKDRQAVAGINQLLNNNFKL